MTKALFRLLSRIEWAIVIQCDAPVWYLGRIYLWDWLRDRLPGVFLHRFFASDGDRELHNHPWESSWSLVLWGGYREERLEGDVIRVYERRPLSINRIDHDTFHRVKLYDEKRGAWTLFIAGRRCQDWGFIDIETRRFETHKERERRRTAEELDRLAQQAGLRAWTVLTLLDAGELDGTLLEVELKQRFFVYGEEEMRTAIRALGDP